MGLTLIVQMVRPLLVHEQPIRIIHEAMRGREMYLRSERAIVVRGGPGKSGQRGKQEEPHLGQ